VPQPRLRSRAVVPSALLRLRAHVGPACDATSPSVSCGDGWCDPVTSHCLPLPGAGDDCTLDGQCGFDTLCAADQGKCLSLPGEHELCLLSTTPQCASELVCVGAVCQRPTDRECP
jgi:hypothetical protein